MNDETTRILTLAGAYPLLGIDAVRARQIAAECASLLAACNAATQRFHESGTTSFAKLFLAPAAVDPLP